ncbi:MAG: GGDEF domain-containing protein [Clostridiales bacterium]|nr:GGDEF domain-containing protein [Clostridiales bacterium]
MYYHKKIGVFISHIYGYYQSELCQGIIDRASYYGYRVEIFSSNDGENFGNNKIGENSILRIPNFDKYSGIIFASSTYPVPKLRDDIYTVLKKECDCPVIEVNQINPVFPSIALDNDSATIEIVEHLIQTHMCKRICFLGNSIETIYSQNRYNYYLKTMEKYNMKVSNKDYYTSNYSTKEIDSALDYFLEGDKKPDAILCYNDAMALKVMISLINRGYNIPKDIAVTGFDTLEFGQKFNPPLTSVSYPIKDLGFAAVDTLIKLINNKPVPQISVVKAKPTLGGSCGCSQPIKDNPILFSHKLLNEYDSMERFLINDINMSSILHGITDIDEGMNLLERYVSLIDNCHEFYLCLYNNWDWGSDHIQKLTYSQDKPQNNTILLKLAIKDGKRLHECSFSCRNSLPDYIYNNSKSTYIYSPLFFNELEFGYVVVSYKDNQLAYKFNFTSWLMNVNRMLKHICDTKQMDLLVRKLETLHHMDELTNLYNSNTFNQLANELILKAQETKKSISFIIITLNNTKTIMESFGFKELNFAIQVIGHAIKSSMDEGHLCAHIIEGRFYIISEVNSNESPINFIKKVQAYLENYNKLQTKDYTILIQSGYSIHKANPLFSLEDYIENATKDMYKSKSN